MSDIPSVPNVSASTAFLNYFDEKVAINDAVDIISIYD